MGMAEDQGTFGTDWLDGSLSGSGDDYDYDSSSSSGDEDTLAPFNDMFVANRNRRPNVNSTPFRNGRQVGVRQAQNIWDRLGGSCRLAWDDYPSAINTLIQRLQRASPTDRNAGRIAGLREELQLRRRECNGRNPPSPSPNPRRPVCVRFGNEAARRIAWDFCNPGWRSTSQRNNRSWSRDCRNVAIDQCNEQVATEVQKECGWPGTRAVRQLQNECRGQVDRMIGNRRGNTQY